MPDPIDNLFAEGAMSLDLAEDYIQSETEPREREMNRIAPQAESTLSEANLTLDANEPASFKRYDREIAFEVEPWETVPVPTTTEVTETGPLLILLGTITAVSGVAYDAQAIEDATVTVTNAVPLTRPFRVSTTGGASALTLTPASVGSLCILVRANESGTPYLWQAQEFYPTQEACT